jgi:hypothetical protein
MQSREPCLDRPRYHHIPSQSAAPECKFSYQLLPTPQLSLPSPPTTPLLQASAFPCNLPNEKSSTEQKPSADESTPSQHLHSPAPGPCRCLEGIKILPCSNNPREKTPIFSFAAQQLRINNCLGGAYHIWKSTGAERLSDTQAEIALPMQSHARNTTLRESADALRRELWIGGV